MCNTLRIGACLFVFIFSAVAVADDFGEIDTTMIRTSGTYYNNADEVISETVRFVTAYNVGDPNQTYGNPCVSANGEDICRALILGEKRCAANFVPLGTELFIERYGRCMVTDRTNSRYRNRVDIAMKLNEFKKAIQFGKQKLKVKILRKTQPFSY